MQSKAILPPRGVNWHLPTRSHGTWHHFTLQLVNAFKVKTVFRSSMSSCNEISPSVAKLVAFTRLLLLVGCAQLHNCTIAHQCTIALVHNCKCVKIFEIEIKKRESLKLSGATYLPYVWFDKKIIYNFNSFWFQKNRGNLKINLLEI